MSLTWKAQLAEELPTPAFMHYLDAPNWYIEQKLDGIRLLAVVDKGHLRLLNRDGGPLTKVQNGKLSDLGALAGMWVFDGEWMGSYYVVFDLLRFGRMDLEKTPFHKRRTVLDEFFNHTSLENVRLIHSAKTKEEKVNLALEVVRGGGEGLVLKQADAEYEQGERVRHMLKVKFVKELDAVVIATGIDGKNNCAYGVYIDGTETMVPIGRCSLNGKPQVRAGAVITVRYLYARRPTAANSGDRLVQPRLVRTRRDKQDKQCLLSQVVYTNEPVNHKDLLLPALYDS